MEMANSYIKMLLLPTRGTCNCLQNRVGFFFFLWGGGGGGVGGGHEQGARETPDGKDARKITPVLQAPDRLPSELARAPRSLRACIRTAKTKQKTKKGLFLRVEL